MAFAAQFSGSDAQNLYVNTVSMWADTVTATYYSATPTISVYGGSASIYFWGNGAAVPGCTVDSKYANGNGQCNNFGAVKTQCVTFTTMPYPQSNLIGSTSVFTSSNAATTVTALQSARMSLGFGNTLANMVATIVGPASLWGNNVFITPLSSCASATRTITIWTGTTPTTVPTPGAMVTTAYTTVVSTATVTVSNTVTNTATQTDTASPASSASAGADNNQVNTTNTAAANASGSVPIIAGLAGASFLLFAAGSTGMYLYFGRRRRQAAEQKERFHATEYGTIISTRSGVPMMSNTLFGVIQDAHEQAALNTARPLDATTIAVAPTNMQFRSEDTTMTSF